MPSPVLISEKPPKLPEERTDWSISSASANVRRSIVIKAQDEASVTNNLAFYNVTIGGRLLVGVAATLSCVARARFVPGNIDRAPSY